MKELPKISIVTPSYNQAQFLEKTILSVFNQDYPNLEYIILDGGSTDGSVDIIRKYEDGLTCWVSEPDDGQADAVYRGFERSSGEILAWLNSDDYYLPGALKQAGHFFASHPKAEWLIGNSIVVDGEGQELFRRQAFPVSFETLLLWGRLGFHQQATFWRREPFFATGGFDRSLVFCFDYDLYLRLARRQRPDRINRFLAAFRKHPEAKTSRLEHVRRQEEALLFQRHGLYDYHPLYVKFVQTRCEAWGSIRYWMHEARIWGQLHLWGVNSEDVHTCLFG